MLAGKFQPQIEAVVCDNSLCLGFAGRKILVTGILRKGSLACECVIFLADMSG